MNLEFEGTIEMINKQNYSNNQTDGTYCQTIHNKKFILLHPQKTQNLEFEIFYYNPYVFDESKEDFRRNYYPGFENIDAIYINFNINKTKDEHEVLSTSQIPLFDMIYDNDTQYIICPHKFDIKISYDTNTNIFEIITTFDYQVGENLEQVKRVINGHLIHHDVPIPTLENYQGQDKKYHKQYIVSGYTRSEN